MLDSQGVTQVGRRGPTLPPLSTADSAGPRQLLGVSGVHPLTLGGVSCRAAAYSKLGNYAGAVQDCERAICIDPSYSKAYGRMG